MHFLRKDSRVARIFEKILGFGAMSAPCVAALAGLAACSSIPPAPNGKTGILQDLARRGREEGALERGGDPSAAATAVDDVNGAGQVIPARFAAMKLRWPLRYVRITSPFGRRGREFHEGIDLHARMGTPVFAAQKGRVIYAGSGIRGYGKMVIIKHSAGVATIYAHNSRILVRIGQLVRVGQRIAMTGRTGHASGPHLHFEVRSGVAAINPLAVLPGLHSISGKRSVSRPARASLTPENISRPANATSVAESDNS